MSEDLKQRVEAYLSLKTMHSCGAREYGYDAFVSFLINGEITSLGTKELAIRVKELTEQEDRLAEALRALASAAGEKGDGYCQEFDVCTELAWKTLSELNLLGE